MFNGMIDNNYSTEELDDIVCKNGLLQYNIDSTNGLLLKPGITINLVGRDENGHVVGGIMCNTYLMCLDIDVLWVHESHRGEGLGYGLMSEAERIAKDAGCKFAITTTFSYQAPDFYIKQGYEIYAIVDDFPEDICMYRLKKKL